MNSNNPSDRFNDLLKMEDDYLTAVAYLIARRSKDTNTQVGAAIVDANNCIIGVAYNIFQRNCSDDNLAWARKPDSELYKKYPYAVVYILNPMQL